MGDVEVLNIIRNFFRRESRGRWEDGREGNKMLEVVWYKVKMKEEVIS